jgi:hypothetical protein
MKLILFGKGYCFYEHVFYWWLMLFIVPLFSKCNFDQTVVNSQLEENLTSSPCNVI